MPRRVPLDDDQDQTPAVRLRPSGRPWLLLVALTTACATTRDTVRTQFASEHGCAESLVEVSVDSATRYRARGCNEEAVYVCSTATRIDSHRSDCVEEGRRSRDDYRERERPVLPPPDPRIPRNEP